MDKITQNYRKKELEKVDTEYSEFKTKIKIIKPNGETKWLDIEPDEFNAIAKILLGDDAKKVQTPESKGWKNFPQGLVDCQ